LEVLPIFISRWYTLASVVLNRISVVLLVSCHSDHQLWGAVDHDQQVVESLLGAHVALELGNEDALTDLEQFLSVGKLFVKDALRVSIEDDSQESTHRVYDRNVDSNNAHGHGTGQEVADDCVVVDHDDEVLLAGSLGFSALLCLVARLFRGIRPCLGQSALCLWGCLLRIGRLRVCAE